MLKANEAQVMVQVLGGWDSKQWDTMQKLLTISRLAKKHHRLAEMGCNGEGWIRGQHYNAGTTEDWNSKSAYVKEDTTVFQVESDKVEAKITALVSQLGTGWTVEFQGDPRGNTVKVSHNNRQIYLA